MKKSTLQPWEIIKSRDVFVAAPWITVAVQQVRLPDGKVVDDYYQIAMPEVVTVFAQTIDGDVIVVRQYKHGLGKVTLVLPAGSIDGDEEPLAAAQRELLEETGFRADNWRALGVFVGNGTYGCGRVHIFTAQDAQQVSEPDSGDLEEMETILMKPEEIVDAVQRGDVELIGTVATIALATNLLAPGSVV